MKPPSLKAIGLVNGVVFVGVIASFLIPQIDKVRDWRASEKLIAQQDQAAEIQRRNIERAKELADTASANQIATVPELIVQGYVAAPGQQPDVDWNHSVDPNTKTFIYDQYRACIGFAYEGQFYSYFDNPNNCNRNEVTQ